MWVKPVWQTTPVMMKNNNYVIKRWTCTHATRHLMPSESYITHSWHKYRYNMGQNCSSAPVFHFTSKPLSEKQMMQKNSFISTLVSTYYTTVTLKISLYRLVITLTCINQFWQFFGKNIKKEEENIRLLMSYLTYLKVTKHKNCTWSLKCCITGLPNFNQSMLDFFNLADS